MTTNLHPSAFLRRAALVWSVLIIATIVSWTVGANHGIDGRLGTVLVLLVTFTKVYLVGMNFMELREAVLPLRIIFSVLCFGLCAVLTGLYLTSASVSPP